MTYIVLEVQTTGGVSAIVPPLAYTDRLAAEGQYHSILASAATSAVEEHAVLLLAADGRLIRSECYRHEAEPAPEPSPEPEPEEPIT